MCPLCNKAEDTTEHVLECETEQTNKKYKLYNNTVQEWEDITYIFRKNKEKRDKLCELIFFKVFSFFFKSVKKTKSTNGLGS